MSQPFDLLQTQLKAAGQSMTRSRKVVFSVLLDHEPQTMHELTQACSEQVDRASVYRTIALFERLGIVQRLQIGWKYKLELSDDYSHHHHHLTCTSCGKTFTLPEDQQLEQRLNDLAKSLNFEPQAHQIEMRGRCYDCRAAGLDT